MFNSAETGKCPDPSALVVEVNVLVVLAHPLKDSLCHRLAEHVCGELRGAGHDVVVEDLYELHFNPKLSSSERRRYNAPDYRAEGDMRRPIERLLVAEAIVLVFPTWWSGLPAILKGWVDRVWVPDIAFDHRQDVSVLKPLLGNLRYLVVVTTLASPWWLDWFLLGRPVAKMFKYALLPSCAVDCRFRMLSLYRGGRIGETRFRGFKIRISRVLSGLH
ncbi:NAD(P)H-dependent oxidoreductase [Dongia soli]|uniref:NAD(P)H-dependent oxidoreductase n=1 Tax=Dongia soli TaxID=600628 RepID=A0ABU5EHH9_9PROT|nr:NAD(P)H-dependent oxidoreductase [Dongia soli]MDY0884883.1 NAD(P)H-dependent oxidoreductase [Dongia soli]